MTHATVSLTMTLPRKGIWEAPEAYHHILYAASARKHGSTKTEWIFNDLYRESQHGKCKHLSAGLDSYDFVQNRIRFIKVTKREKKKKMELSPARLYLEFLQTTF